MKKPRKPKPGSKRKQNLEQLPPQPPGSGKYPRRKQSIWRPIEIAAALFATAYLGYDLFYQSKTPDIEVSASENNSPFSLPFTVKTQSIVFDMHRTSFQCSFDLDGSPDVDGKPKLTARNVQMTFGGQLKITKQNPGSYFCRNQIPSAIVLRLVTTVSPRYCTNILGLYCWERVADPVIFTWIKTGNSGYWIKGNIGN